MEVQGRYFTKLDSGWVNQWKTLVNNAYPVESDEQLAQEIGYNGIPVPYQALVNYALCELVNVFSIHCLYHLSIAGVEQLRPVHYGDSLKASMCVTDIRPSSDKKYCIVKNIIILRNTNGKPVLRMERTSLFQYFVPFAETKPIPVDYLKFKKSKKQRHIDKTIAELPAFKDNLPLRSFSGINLIAHDSTSIIDIAQGNAYCNLFRNNHPVHLNKKRFGADQLAVSGGLILPVVCGIAAVDFERVFKEEIMHTSHFNKLHYGEMLSAMSYIHSSHPISEGVYEFHLITYGVREIDVSHDLAKSKIPLEIFYLKKLRPKELEKIVLHSCPELSAKLVMKIEWKVLIGVK